jgi:hypothetical protein
LKNTNNKEDVVRGALDQLIAGTGWEALWLPEAEARFDGRMKLKRPGQTHTFNAVVVSTVLPGQLAKWAALRDKDSSVILIAGRISEDMSAQLRALGLNYLEHSGNARIMADGIFLHIEGRKGGAPMKREHVFTRASVQLIFHLLTRPSLLQEPYRAIAAATGASLDNISKTIHALREKDYLLPLQKGGYQWAQKQELAERWVSEYGERLRPRLLMGRYRMLSDTDWQEIALEPGKTQWSGEPGADLLTERIRPEQFALYTHESRQEIIRNYRLAPDPQGEVFVYRAFWDMGAFPAGKTAPALLIYADLLLSGSARNVEIAKMIRDEQKETFLPAV